METFNNLQQLYFVYRIFDFLNLKLHSEYIFFALFFCVQFGKVWITSVILFISYSDGRGDENGDGRGGDGDDSDEVMLIRLALFTGRGNGDTDEDDEIVRRLFCNGKCCYHY